MIEAIRKTLLRILISWWAVPYLWLVALPITWLICGSFKKHVKDAKEISMVLMGLNAN